MLRFLAPEGRLRALLAKGLRHLPAGAKQHLAGAAARFDVWRYERMLARGYARDERTRAADPLTGLPVPPALLRVRVTGFLADRETWLRTSAVDAELIRGALERAGRPIEGMRAILDFGCGCGRVARHWGVLQGPEIHGADVSRGGVRWCRRHLRFMDTVRSDHLPPLPYPDGRFDFIYSLSVLTHLPEQAGRDWLAELARVLEPGGLLLFTVHGPRFLPHLEPDEAERFRNGEVVVRSKPETLVGTNEYAAFHPPEWARSALPEAGLEVVEAVYDDPTGEGVTPMPVQDNYLVRRLR
jgi:SAM-dependent methyltransferase